MKSAFNTKVSKVDTSKAEIRKMKITNSVPTKSSSDTDAYPYHCNRTSSSVSCNDLYDDSSVEMETDHKR